MLRIAEDGGYDFAFLRGVIAVNDQQFERVVQKVEAAAGGDLRTATIGVLGLTFKAGTDDLRESPALEVLQRLQARGATVRAFDPSIPDGKVDPRKAAMLEGIEVTADPYAGCEGDEALVGLTEWDEFKWLDLDKVHAEMATPNVVDARNLLDRSALLRRGFSYRAVGRP